MALTCCIMEIKAILYGQIKSLICYQFSLCYLSIKDIELYYIILYYIICFKDTFPRLLV